MGHKKSKGKIEKLKNRGTNGVARYNAASNRLTNMFLSVCSRVAPARDIYSSTNSYAYDAGNRLTNMVLNSFSLFPSNFSLQEISYSYNPTNGLASSWTNSASGIFCSYEYDIMDRPISLAWKASDGSIIKSYDYMYSNSDMITNVVDNTGNITKYEFDTLDRLTSEDDGDNITSYSYDLAGNRTQKIVTTNQTNHTNNYALGIGNRLATFGTNGVARYNTAGCLTNMVSDVDGRELNLGWNSQYQLVSVDVFAAPESGTAEAGGLYDYNVLGQRISRKEISGSTTNTEYYIHEGVNIVADLDENKELLRSYSYAPGYDNIISMTIYGNDTNTYFYIRNHINSVVALIDENGDISESYDYDAYGAVTVFDSNDNELDESALGNRYTFQGLELDYTTGLYNFRARWYDAETGRWLSKDPIGISGGLNQYVFCSNNPVNFVDPEGLEEYDLVYEFINPSEFTPRQKKSQPKNTKYVDSPQDIITDIKTIKDKDPNAIINSIIISNHGDGNGTVGFKTCWYSAAYDIDNPRNREAKEFLEKLASYLDENGTIRFLMCEAGMEPYGGELLDDLKSIYGDNQQVVIYNGICGFVFGKPMLTSLFGNKKK